MIARTAFFFIVAFLWISARLIGQDLDPVNRDARPKYGIGILTDPFTQIQFSPEQLERLSMVELELILRIDTEGYATLLGVNGIREPIIIDSIYKKFEQVFLNFYPRMENGIPVGSIYSFTLHIPKVSTPRGEENAPLGRYLKPENMKSYSRSGKRLDFLIGLMANTHTGNAANYLYPGGGLKVDIMYGGTNLSAGMVIALYANSLKLDYPITTTRDRSKLPITFLIGLGANKVFMERKRSEFIMQFELTYATETITPPLYSGDYDYVEFRGWSPGFVANYLIRIGKDKFGSESAHTYKPPEPVVYYSYINIHAALRPLYFDSKEASGLMAELGISYRFSSHFLKGYELK